VAAPYAKVHGALVQDPQALFHRATAGAAEQTRSLVASLRVKLAGLEVSAEVTVEILEIHETTSPLGEHRTRVNLAWKAANAAGFFPTMMATIDAYPLTATETQLELQGKYRPPLGLVGNAADALVGHRIAEASVHRFIEQVAAQLNSELSGARA
jgi:hypothetical protein